MFGKVHHASGRYLGSNNFGLKNANKYSLVFVFSSDAFLYRCRMVVKLKYIPLLHCQTWTDCVDKLYVKAYMGKKERCNKWKGVGGALDSSSTFFQNRLVSESYIEKAYFGQCTNWIEIRPKEQTLLNKCDALQLPFR